jgi:hypothetical protein
MGSSEDAFKVDDTGDDRVTGGRDEKAPVDEVAVTQHGSTAVEGVVVARNESLDFTPGLARSTVIAVPPSEVLTSVHDRLLQGCPVGSLLSQPRRWTDRDIGILDGVGGAAGRSAGATRSTGSR